MNKIKCVMVLWTAFALNAYAADIDEVKVIRKIYQTAQQNKQNENKIVIERNVVYCGAGLNHKKAEIILNNQHKPALIREHVRIGVQNYYREYLFNQHGMPIFYYIDDNTHDGNKQERIYFLNQDKIHTKPENLNKNVQELKAIKDTFTQYADLVNLLQTKNKAVEIKNPQSRLIQSDEAKNYIEIKQIDDELNKIERNIKLSQQENYLHLKANTTVSMWDKDNTLTKLTFPLSSSDDCSVNRGSLELLQIEEDDGMFGENYFFQNNRLKRYDWWESVEGGEKIVYFLNNQKIYCLGSFRVPTPEHKNGDFQYIMSACHQDIRGGLPFFPKELTDEEQFSQKYLKIFEKLWLLELI